MQITTTIEKKTARHQPDLALCAWVGSALPGATFEYHHGDLALDRTPFGRFGDTPARAALALVAGCALDLAGRGLLHLVQRRHGPHDYSYLAIVRARPEPASAPADQPSGRPRTAVLPTAEAA